MSVLNAVVRILDSYPLQLLVCAHMFAFSFLGGLISALVMAGGGL